MDESGWILFSLNVNSQNSASFFFQVLLVLTLFIYYTLDAKSG